MSAFDQIRYLRYELNLAVNRRWWRWFTIWFGKGPGVTISYRLARGPWSCTMLLPEATWRESRRE